MMQALPKSVWNHSNLENTIDLLNDKRSNHFFCNNDLKIGKKREENADCRVWDKSLRNVILQTIQEISETYDSFLDSSLNHQIRQYLLNELKNVNKTTTLPEEKIYLPSNLFEKTKHIFGAYFCFTSRFAHINSVQGTNKVEEIFIDLIKESVFRIIQYQHSRDYEESFVCVTCRREFSLVSCNNEKCCERYLKFVQNENDMQKRKDITEQICLLQDKRFFVISAANISETLTLVFNLNKNKQTRQKLFRMKTNLTRISRSRNNRCNCEKINGKNDTTHSISTKSFCIVKDALKKKIYIDLVVGCIEIYEKYSSCKNKIYHLCQWLNSYCFECFKQGRRNWNCKKNESKLNLFVVKVILIIYARLKSAIKTLEIIQRTFPVKEKLFEKSTTLPSSILDLQDDFMFVSYYLDPRNLETLNFAHTVIYFTIHEVLSLEKKENMCLKAMRCFRVMKSSGKVTPSTSIS